MEPSDIYDYFRSRSDQLVEDLKDLVRIDTPSRDAARIQAFVTHLRVLLEPVVFRCRELEGAGGPQLLAEIDGEDPAASPLILVGHSDTVWAEDETAHRPPEVRDGKLYGPGVYDMKAGVFLMVAAARFLREHDVSLRRKLQIFIAADEEIGGVTAHPWMDELLSTDATALVPEPPCPDGSLKIRRKGVGIYKLMVTGREAHAGVAPELGINSIIEIARMAVDIQSWQDPGAVDDCRDSVHGRVLLNVGEIGGGTASNVVPGEAWCRVDVRYEDPADGEEIDRRLRGLRPSHPDARFEIEGGLIFPPLVPTPESRRLSEVAIRIAGSLGLEIDAGSSGGGSDGSYLASRGLTVLDGLGVDGDGAHAQHEHIIVASLPLRAAVLTALILELGND